MNDAKLLDRWRGGRARFWEYRISHKGLIIRVEQVGRSGNLHIGCNDVSHICGPTEWMDASFVIEDLRPDLVLRDAAAGVEVRCGLIECAENCKPL